MTEQIDHAAQAVLVLGNFPHEHIADSETALAWAQVHATLALVEQQRIANLIAAFEMEGGPHKAANEWIADEYGDGEEDANVRILREIREVLGLS